MEAKEIAEFILKAQFSSTDPVIPDELKLLAQAYLNLLKQQEGMVLDARRYKRLQVLGCAPSTSLLLDKGLVLRFSNLDKFIDEDIKVHPSRGETPHE